MNRPGMTLVELLVSLLITGAILAAGYGAFAATLDTRERLEKTETPFQRAIALRTSLSALLGSAYVTAQEDGPAFMGTLAGGQSDTQLAFPALAVPPLTSARGMVELYVDADSLTREQGLVLRSTPIEGGSSKVVQLSSHVQQLGVRYLVEEDGQHVWKDAWVSSLILPMAVELRLTVDDDLDPIARYPLLVTLAGR